MRAKWLAVVLLGVVALLRFSPASAGPIEFATFSDVVADQPFSFTNNGATSATISVASAPVIFNFTAPTGLGTADRPAILTISNLPPTFTPGFPLGGGMLDQPISSPTTLTITEQTTGKNLLTVTFTGDLVGRNGGPSATLSGANTTGQVATFSSAFLNFTQPGNSYNLKLGTISPTLTIGPGNFLNSFHANVIGQFGGNISALAATPPPSLTPPTASPTPSAPYQFAVFSALSANQPLSFTNNGATSGTMSASAQITFHFTAPTGLDTGDRSATLTISNNPTFTPGFPLGGGMLDQPISSPTTLRITENGTGKNLLTVQFTGDIVGRTGPVAALSGADTTGQVVTYSSDFLTFTQPGNSYDLGLETLVPPLSIGPGNFLNSFLADLDGEFTGRAVAVPQGPPPSPPPPVPEPSALALLALGTAALVSGRRWRQRHRPATA